MNSRLQALIDRGYSKEEVEKLALFTEEELEYASICAFKHISRNCTSVDLPNAIYIGGQPGSGKTVMSMNLKNEIGNIIEIGIDNYRMYHPRYIEIENCIKRHWENRTETINDTPGNDIADFTHFFAGAMTDKLIEMGKSNKYNMLLEWGMREPKGPLNSMRDLKKNGYNNVVLFVSTHRDISYNACELRTNIIKNSEHIFRKVPKSFHDLSVESLPDSINYIHEYGLKENIIDYMALLTRDNKIVWEFGNSILPGDVYKECLNNMDYINNKINDSSYAFITNKKELEGISRNIAELNKLKSEIVYVDSRIFNINNKIK
ncbi:MAG: zeta toxin family protein [Bacilli bacterium]|nr:zeta toxin family protein [Bacilli bacterium]